MGMGSTDLPDTSSPVLIGRGGRSGSLVYQSSLPDSKGRRRGYLSRSLSAGTGDHLSFSPSFSAAILFKDSRGFPYVPF